MPAPRRAPLRLARLCSWAAVVLAAGCAPAPVRNTGWTSEQGFAPLLGQSSARFERLHDLTAEARVTVRGADGALSGVALVQVRNPDLLRLEVRGGPLLSHVFTALERGDSLFVQGRGADDAWKGEVRGPLLFALTGVDLSWCDLRYALLGVVEPGLVDAGGAVEHPRRGAAVVPVLAGGTQRRVWVDLKRGLVTREDVVLPEAGPPVRRLLRDYRSIAGVLLPGRVEISQGARCVTIEYRSVAVDRGLEEAALLKGLPLDRMRSVEPSDED